MRSRNLANLTGLWLDTNGLTDVGAQAVLDSPYPGNLSEDLTLDDDGISDEMVIRLHKKYGHVLFFYRPHLDDQLED